MGLCGWPREYSTRAEKTCPERNVIVLAPPAAVGSSSGSGSIDARSIRDHGRGHVVRAVIGELLRARIPLLRARAVRHGARGRQQIDTLDILRADVVPRDQVPRRVQMALLRSLGGEGLDERV